MTNFPNGVASFGMPLFPATMGLPLGGGKVVWVSSTYTGGASNGDFDRPYLTVEAALNSAKIRANKGDIIYIKPAHTEAVTSTSLNIDKAGVTIIGLGMGADKPEFTFAATNSAINVTAPDCVLANVRITAGVGNVVTAFLHATAAQGTQYRGIEFTNSSTFNFINCYTLGAANISDRCLWDSNTISNSDAGQLSLIVTAAAHDGLVLTNNRYICTGNATVGALIEAGAANVTSVFISRNFVQTGHTDGSTGVIVGSSGTAGSGCIVDNDMKTADAAANVAVPIASKIYAARNYIAGADEVGTVVAVGTLFDNA